MCSMFEILEVEESISSHTNLKDKLASDISNHMTFIDCGLDPCDELIYRSNVGCELNGTEIGNTDDPLLDVNFLKLDHGVGRMRNFNSNSTERLNKQGLGLLENRECELVFPTESIKEDVVIEEVAEEEVITESTSESNKKLDDAILDIESMETSQSKSGKINELKCYVCEKTFRRKKNLEYHVLSHVTVQECDREIEAVKISNGLQKHDVGSNIKNKINSSHRPRSKLRHIYELPNHPLEDRTDVNEYLKNRKSSKYACLHCERTFLGYAIVAEHARVEHGIKCDRLECLYCKKQCKDLRGLQKHLKVHLGGVLLKCNTCGKQFYSRNRLKRHMLTHRDKAVVCEECGETVIDQKALANHRSSHHVISTYSSALTTKTFPCFSCDKVFSSRSSLQIHTRTHTGERPYACRFCVKAFADGGTLRKHERIHTGEKPYVCPVCQKAFNQRVVLREHIRAHHASSNNATTKSYDCEVCSASCLSSQDLCGHLVKHSDDNTAKHRAAEPQLHAYKKRRLRLKDRCDDSVSCRPAAVVDVTGSERNFTVAGGDSFYVLVSEQTSVDFANARLLPESSVDNGCHPSSLTTDLADLPKIGKMNGDSFAYQLLLPLDKLPDDDSSCVDIDPNLIESSDRRQAVVYFETAQYTPIPLQKVVPYVSH